MVREVGFMFCLGSLSLWMLYSFVRLSVRIYLLLFLAMPPSQYPRYMTAAKQARNHSVSMAPILRNPDGRVKFSPIPVIGKENLQLVRKLLGWHRGFKDVALCELGSGSDFFG